MALSKKLRRRPSGTRVMVTLGTCLALSTPTTLRAESKSPKLEIELGILPEVSGLDPCPAGLTDVECFQVKHLLFWVSKLPTLIQRQAIVIDARHAKDVTNARAQADADARVDVLSDRGFSWWHVIGVACATFAVSALLGIFAGIAIAAD